MASLTFDTHEIVKELKAAGFSEGQAEAVTRAVQKAQEARFAELATKADLQSEVGVLRADVKEAELRLEAKIEATKTDLLKWMIGAIGVQTLVIVGAVVALARALGP